jgi:delta24(24(1))-sterol reductase
MWQEVRIPWVLLFHIAISAGLKQYQTIGYITPVSPLHLKLNLSLV